MKGGIPSGPDGNEGLNIARNLRQISGVILIESYIAEVTDGDKGVDLLSRIYTKLKWAIKTLALSLSLMAKWLDLFMRRNSRSIGSSFIDKSEEYF